ncbi:MAG: protein kinase [Alphaproteobacteria bacterium]|nr:protein kinase [Alphaproteobacteria bacterium]
MSFHAGETLGRWLVDDVLSYGSPWLLIAHDAENPDIEAVLQVAERSKTTERWYKRSARALRALQHPAFPDLIEAKGTESHVFLAVQPFDADPMSAHMAEGHVDWQLACTWLYELARALQFMHEQGWVHGGLSPDTIYISTTDRIRLLGLRCATPIGERAPIPRDSVTYIAPEVLQDPDHNGPRADLYAFGCIAYELLAREPAFPAAAWGEHPDPARVLLEWKTKTEALDPGPEQPDWLRSLVKKCTHPEPDHRLPDMDTVVAWLEGSRASWRIVPPNATPVALPRGQEPTLVLQPSFDTDALARQFAQHAAALQGDYRGTHDMLVIVSAALGAAAGLCLAVLAVFYLEISQLV